MKFTSYTVSRISRNLNEFEIEPYKLNKIKWYSWGWSSDRNRNHLEIHSKHFSKHKPFKSELETKWNSTRLECELTINQVAYKYRNRWHIREFKLLEQLNNTPVEFYNHKPNALFIEKAFREIKSLNNFVIQHNDRMTKENKVFTWIDAIGRATHKFNKLLKGKIQNPFIGENLWDLCYDNILRIGVMSKAFKNLRLMRGKDSLE